MRHVRHVGLVKKSVGVAFLLAGLVWLQPAWAARWLEPAAYRLETASRALLNNLVASMHHRDAYADDEVLAVLAAGAIQGQAQAFRTLLEQDDISDADLRVAARALERQTDALENRVLHAHATSQVRRDFRRVENHVDAMLRQLDTRLIGRRSDDDEHWER
ncbi:MAG: hypothetical protein ACRERD_10790 [Candidatus Binatia bacterium]